MSWVPSGFGWNVITLNYLQTTVLEVGISLGVWSLFRMFSPILSRMAKLVRLADKYAPDDSEVERRMKEEGL